MKTTFTLLIMMGLLVQVTAQRNTPFNRKAETKAKQKVTQLKSSHSTFLPSSIAVDYWEGNDWVFDYSISFEYDAAGNVTVMTSQYNRTLNVYDDQNRLTQSTNQRYDDGSSSYVNEFRNSYAYDEYDRIRETIYEIWQIDTWVMASGERIERSYDTEGNMLSEIFSYYQEGIGWVETNGYKIERTYTDDLLKEETRYYLQDNAWLPTYKTEFFYNGNPYPVSALDYEGTDGVLELIGRYIDVSWYYWNGDLDKSYLETYTFQAYQGTGDINAPTSYVNDEKMEAEYPEGDGNGRAPVIIETYLDWFNASWHNYERYTYEDKDNYESTQQESWEANAWLKTYYDKLYQSDLLIYHIQHHYDSGVLIQVDKETTEMDNFGNIIEEKTEMHAGDEVWIQMFGSLYELSYEGTSAKLLERITKLWIPNLAVYQNSTRERYHYTATNVNEIDSQGITVHPTLFRSYLYVTSDAPYVKATIYNLTGKLMMQTTLGKGRNTLSTGSLPKGYYILKVNNQVFNLLKR
ncbi:MULTISPECIES: T9SS type A sorting domain-containing protein [unclassified Carboxylicivirga]|uniref:T9SS type A sorting domain-containing protein n=1 Tax=Carboxylicivirga TaxID=1628153 RepID=UPI003D328F9D